MFSVQRVRGGSMKKAAVAVLGGLVLASPAFALAPAAEKPAPELQRLMNCRSIQDSTARLACFDQGSQAIDQALSTKNLVVINREQAREARRSLFGFSVPSFAGLLGNDDSVRQIESTITGFGRTVDGGWIFRLADGTVWAQSNDTPLGMGPRPGDKVRVRSGLLGSFVLVLNNQPGVKVTRIK